MQLPFGPFRPDVGGPNSGFATLAQNVLPQTASSGLGYGPMPALVTASGAVALSAAPRGVIAAIKNDGSYAIIAATATTIQLMASDYTWSNLETGRTVTAGDDVAFAQFGKYVLNSDTTSGLKAYDVDAGGANSAVSGGPAAKALFVCNNVVFGLGVSGSPRRFQSSAIGDHTNWTTQGADGKTFEDGGELVGGRDIKNGAGVMFQKDAMRLVQFGTGGSALYSIQKVADGRGAVSDRSIVAFDGMVFYLATDGFYKFTLQGGNEPIGAERVNRWLATQITPDNYENVIGAVDPYNKVVWWRLSSSLLLGYDWQLNEFFTAAVTTSTLTRIATPGVSIDTLTSTIDSVSETIDSRLWAGGALVFGALDGSYKFATFSGSSLEATLISSTVAMPQWGWVNWATPDCDADAATLSLGVADNRAATLAWKDPVAVTDSGRVPLRGRGRLFALKQVVPASSTWTYANGLQDVELVNGGVR